MRNVESVKQSEMNLSLTLHFHFTSGAAALMDFELIESSVSEKELLSARESKKVRSTQQQISRSVSPMIVSSLHISAPLPFQIPKWNPTASKAKYVTPEEFHAKRKEPSMTWSEIRTEVEKWEEMGPPDIGYSTTLRLDMKVGGKSFAFLKRDLWRGEKFTKKERIPLTWMIASIDYFPSKYEEYRYGSILDAQWIVEHCSTQKPSDVPTQEVTVFSGKQLSIFPAVKARFWAWNPKYADKLCWNHLYLALDRWDSCKDLGKELHERDSYSICSIESCNCFIDGKHVSYKTVYYVPHQLFVGTKLWFKDETQEGYYTMQTVVMTKNGQAIQVLPEYKQLVGPIGYTP